jgi:hypothetical protein
MLKNYRNFVNVSENVVVNSHIINLRDLLNTSGGMEMACAELNKKLYGRNTRARNGLR